MAMPSWGLLFLGGFALLASFGLFVTFDDDATTIVVTMLSSILWGVFGLSAFSVRTVSTYYATRTEAIYPLVYLGFALAVVTFMFGLYNLMQVVYGEVESADIESMP